MDLDFLGRIILSFEKGKFSLKWLDENKNKFLESDVIILKLRDIEILRLTIGSMNDITQPQMLEWISKEIGPAEEPIILKAYRKRRSP